MGRVFAVRPKRIKRTNGQVLTPEMEITVTTKSSLIPQHFDLTLFIST